MRERLRALQLGDERYVGGIRFEQQLPRPPEVCRALDEAEGDQIDAEA